MHRVSVQRTSDPVANFHREWATSLPPNSGQFVMPPNSHNYRRMVSRLPDQMKTLMGFCGQGVVIVAYHAGSMGWSVDFQIKGTDFRLEYDRGFLVVVKDPNGESKVVGPKNGIWSSDSLSALADAIMNDSA